MIRFIGDSDDERYCQCCADRVASFEVRGGYPRPSVYCWFCAQDLGIDCLGVEADYQKDLALMLNKRHDDETAHFRCEG